MNNKKIRSIIAIVLALLMVFSLLVSVIPIIARADYDLDQKLQSLQNEKNTLAAQRQNLEEKLKELKEQQSAAIEMKLALEENNKLKQEELDLIDGQINLYSDMIKDKAKEVEDAKDLELKQLERYRTRVRAMEESGGFNMLEIVLQAQNFTDLLTMMDDIGDIMVQDRALEDKYIAARENHEEIKADYEATKLELEEKQDELEEEKAQLEEQIKESEELLTELADAIEATEEEQRAAAEAEAAASAAVLDFIREYNRQKAEEQAQQAAQQQQQQQSGANNNTSSSGPISGTTGPTGGDGYGGNVDNSYTGPTGGDSYGGSTGPTGGYGGTSSTPSYSEGFAWPVPSSYRISSTFKYRWGRQHTGIDIDGFNHDGAPVCASKSGSVIYAGWNGGYGNCVIIDHGSGVQTLYAHMSYISVSVGNYVSQGTTVGGLGSTGNSTGTHCHFEIIIDGYQTDPLPYLSGWELEPGAAD